MPKQDHLVCFLGGSFILGLTEGGRKQIDWNKLSREEWEDYQAGVGIIESCMAMHDTATLEISFLLSRHDS
jgi:endoplasmic reticulum Man9GlcNAc2 1,2-alpha-mannosidase